MIFLFIGDNIFLYIYILKKKMILLIESRGKWKEYERFFVLFYMDFG